MASYTKSFIMVWFHVELFSLYILVVVIVLPLLICQHK